MNKIINLLYCGFQVLMPKNHWHLVKKVAIFQVIARCPWGERESVNTYHPCQLSVHPATYLLQSLHALRYSEKQIKYSSKT